MDSFALRRVARRVTMVGMRAIWNGTVIAASDDTIVVEGNHYFPPESVNRASGTDEDGS